jgi:uncharacterized protein YrzB (UPF0473 family)
MDNMINPAHNGEEDLEQILTVCHSDNLWDFIEEAFDRVAPERVYPEGE